MKKIMLAVALTGTLIGVSSLPGCTQMPTEKRGVTDMRPQIAFKTESERLRGARIILDGLDIGAVTDYLDGVAAVRILSGTHTLRVMLGSEALVEERFYIGDGVNRTFIVK